MGPIEWGFVVPTRLDLVRAQKILIQWGVIKSV